MADLLKFLFKSKFMRKFPNLFSFCSVNFLVYSIIVSCSKECINNRMCEHGTCKETYCECNPGWIGEFCEFCTGRVRLSSEEGIITDGSGNYSEDNQCTWLIDTNRPNSSIRLYLDHFATECSWDHLYIYDGDSIYAPLLAVFSGMIVQGSTHSSRTREIVAKSGTALLYFYSDTLYNLTGFSISFSVDGCPRGEGGEVCSGHGTCINNVCTCNADWSGVDCNQPICPSNCYGNGICDRERHRCDCKEGYTGSDCRQKTEFGWWETYPLALSEPFENVNPLQQQYEELERASHSSVVLGDEVWVIGGYSFSPKSFLLANNLTDNTIRRVEPSSKKKPSYRYGHSSVAYNDSIYIYGGVICGVETNELWVFDPNHRTWVLIDDSMSVRPKRDGGKVIQKPGYPDDLSEVDETKKECVKGGLKTEADYLNGSCLRVSTKSCSPIASMGHAAVVVDDLMLVIFGHSSVLGPLNLVQEYHFKYKRWKVVKTVGAVVSGYYGHSAVWDPERRLVYVHGGLQSATPSQVVANLLTYDPFSNKWSLKRPAPLPRFLHSATLMHGLMFVFGGNTHNDTAFSYGAKCFSADFLVYDLQCDQWQTLPSPPNLRTDTARFGHTAVTAKERMVLLGGFNGIMLGTTLHYFPGKCDTFTYKSKCLRSFPGRKCVWNRHLGKCEALKAQNRTSIEFCAEENSLDRATKYTEFCNSQNSCHSCLHNSYGCVWCNNGCSYEKCTDSKGVVLAVECNDRRKWSCKALKSCQLCHAYKPWCAWLSEKCIFAPNHTSGAIASKLPLGKDLLYQEGNDKSQIVPTNTSSFALQTSLHTCSITCSQRLTCMNCTQGPCMWCFNQQRCVNNSTYLVSFPYGQCLKWTTDTRHCTQDTDKDVSPCMTHQTCKDCQADIACGWCDDGTNTGRGSCLEGGKSGPDSTSLSVPLPKCELPFWYFTSCPPCNCNGHSYCGNDSLCVMPCGNNTTGAYCEKCKDSFYGNPINGGRCKACQCSGHGSTCEHDTGVCHCHTKGVTGKHCDRCDDQNNYYGEPLKDSCFYDLQIDYQFTFNLSKQEDIHIRQINFYNVPSKSNVDTDFDIWCSKAAKIQISAKPTTGHVTWIVKNFTGMSIKQRFSASEYVFGSAKNNTTFHVYVSNFTPPIEIIISFSQHHKLDLIQFFSIFSLCFMVLLLMAFVMWKIKQKYDLYARRQRLMVEMEAMAARPFRAIFLELQLDKATEAKGDGTAKGDAANGGSSVQDGSEPLGALSTAEVVIAEKESPPPPVLQAVTKKKGKTKGSKKNSSNNNGSESHMNSSATILSNGIVQKNVCNGSVGGIHSQISLQTPDTKLIKNKNNPSPISLEPCAGNRAAVLSLLVQLPTGGSRYTSPGHPGGLAVASALVSLGPTRKKSLESPFSEREYPKGPTCIKNKVLTRIIHDSSN